LKFGTNSVLNYKTDAMKRLLLTTVLLSFLFQGNAQRFDYENTSKVFFGVNVGHVWHTSDVENVKKRFPLGAGFVLGGSVNQDYGKAVSFDIRLRYLGGNWYGQDIDTTNAIQNNYAVNQYYDTLGYTVQNFKATQHRLALELSIHANRFKERTGFDPYVFAGIGVTGTKTKGDLLKKTGASSAGTIYPYNSSPNGNIIDQNYTVPLDKNETGEAYESERFEANIMPSLGVGIGYYFNSRFSMGLEHKSTFFMDDYFDGTTVNQSGMPSEKIKNDIYHYTGVYLKWYFKIRERQHTPPNDDTYVPTDKRNEPVVADKPNTNEPTRKRPPIVVFNNPGSSPVRTNNPSFTLRADVQHVSSANNLTFTRNGENHNTFIFNPMTRVFESAVNLNIGENTFSLKGVNNDGSDSDNVIIIYERKVDDRPIPPVVNIVDPSVRPHSVNQLNYIVKADIQNITARNQLTVTFNDQPFNDFSFNPGGSINFNANLNLNAGVNKFKIVGTNNAGMDLDETVIIYTRKASDDTGYPPAVKILTPVRNPHTTAQSTEQVIARVNYVTSKQQIEVKINGVSTTNFTFNTETKRVQFNASLIAGNNNIVVNAYNSFGNDSDKTEIIYRRSNSNTDQSGIPPKVKILAPNANPHSTTNSTANVIAEVENISTKNQIEVILNGRSTNDFTFNNSTKLVQLNMNLIAGSNSVTIKAANSYGNDNAETYIIYRGSNNSGVPPTVKVLTPNTNPFTTQQATVNVVAEVKNVTDKTQIIAMVNGLPTLDFTYNNSTDRVQLNANVSLGNNSVNIKASNDYGFDFDNVQIICRNRDTGAGSTGKPPRVKITTPSATPYTTDQTSIDIISDVENVTSKSQIQVQVNGVNTNDFTYNNSTQRVQLNVNLSVGSNIVNVQATNTHGTDSDDQQIIYRKKAEPAGNPPVVSFIAPNDEFNVVDFATFKVIAKVENVTRKSNVDLIFNGNLINPNDYTYNPAMQTIQYHSDLIVGNNTYIVKGRNDFGTHQASIKLERKGKLLDELEMKKDDNIEKAPCLKPTISITSPANNSVTVANNNFNIQGLFGNIDKTMDIKVFLNGKRSDGFVFNGVTKSFIHKLDLINGENTYLISLTNKCGTVEQEFIINYDAPKSCGVKIDLGSVASDFCLFTSSGLVTRNDLMRNPNFVFNGEAKILYFKARENGVATVNGADFPILKDNFYHFAGEITVDIGRNKAGNIGQWVVCVESIRPPVYGKGNSKPSSPCQTSEDGDQPNTQNPKTPEVRETPNVNKEPTTRGKPARNMEGTTPRGTPNTPAERKGVNVRKPR